MTNISQELRIRIQQVSRNLQRLSEAGLVKKLVSGDYKLSSLGWIILRSVNFLNFISLNDFERDTIKEIPIEHLMTLNVFEDGSYLENSIEFLKFISENLEKASDFVYLFVDNIPYMWVDNLIEASARDAHIQIINEKNFDPIISFNTFYKDSKNKRKLDIIFCEKCNVFIYVSDAGCALSFRSESGFDYKGYISVNSEAIDWSNKLFRKYWDEAQIYQLDQKQLPRKSPTIFEKKIIILGTERPEIDYQSIQNAVDNYEEIILEGIFNLGDECIRIRKSVNISGTGRTNDIPDTKIYKKGWKFPFTEQEFLIDIGGNDVDVLIENIHFENFNGTCINTSNGNSFIARKNRITLLSSLGKGLDFGKWGDHVVGITAGGNEVEPSFKGGIIIENNYLDFALSYTRGGFLDYDGLQDTLEYRPNLLEHELGICVGINICRNSGTVIVRNNVIKNMNSRGILVFDNWNTAEIVIEENEIISNVFGTYPYNSMMAGVGIMAQSAWSQPRSGARVIIRGNKIVLTKINYCGISVHGPAIYSKGAGKLSECSIINNDIYLENGYFGIQIRKSDNIIVEENRLSGKGYYALQISGVPNRNKIDLYARNNEFKNNNILDFEIKNQMNIVKII